MVRITILLFSLTLASEVYAHSLWIPEGNFGYEVARDCYKPLRSETLIKAISPNLLNLDRGKMAIYAKESAELRLDSLDCLLTNIKQTESERPIGELLTPSVQSGFQLEELFFQTEWRILLSENRPYPLTPSELSLAKQWLESHIEIKREILNLTIEYLTEKNPNSRRDRYLDLFTGYYGSLLRERDKFLLSLSVESYSSYTEALKQRKETSE
ncbi:hypothetical protein [Leptospira jelokensis]|uniref:hypothetical protein n=1 Tax=Leptospira jelokensis TaxID=2484931 RepID=UPI001091566A|nr:hypothetical protein [Leptospira jelokensis]TGM04976.1 hypothetical protein EHQ79_02905 [Leptospira jelokensis]